MLPEPEKVKSIFLPFKFAGNFRPDIGIVLACGPDVKLWRGEMVVVDGYQGQWIEGFDIPGYQTKNQVRVYGKCTPFAHGECVPVPWDECVLCHLEPDLSMIAINRNLIVRRDPLVTHENGLELPDYSKYYTGLGTVESVGLDAKVETDSGNVKPGDRIHFDLRTVREFIFEADADLVIIPDLGVNFRIAPEANDSNQPAD